MGNEFRHFSHFHQTWSYLLRVTLLAVALMASVALAANEDGEYDEIVELVEKVNEICPPETCHLISIGRSGTPVTALREGLYPHSVSTLPLSSFRLPSPEAVNLHQSETWRTLKFEAHERFQRYLPSAEDLTGKTVMVLDFTVGGESLFSAFHIIRDYYFHKRANITMGALALVEQSYQGIISKTAQAFETPTRFIPLEESSVVAEKLMRQGYDPVAKYGHAPLSLTHHIFRSHWSYFRFQSRLLKYAAPNVYEQRQKEAPFGMSEVGQLCNRLFGGFLAPQ